MQTDYSRGLVVEGSINGVRANMLIDTGSQRTFISSTLLGQTNNTGAIATFCAGEMCFRESVWAQDTPFSSPDPGGINGFIGMSTLTDLVFGVIPGNGRDPTIRLMSKGEPCDGDAVVLAFTQHGVPFASATYAGTLVKNVVVDSGSLYSTLGSISNTLTGHISDVTDSTLCTINNNCDRKVSLGLMDEMCLGGQCARNVPVKFPIDNTFGASFLTFFRIDFEFSKKRAVFCRP